MRKPPLLHPFLFALFPVLALYGHNLTYVRLPQLVTPLGCALALAGVSLLVAWRVVRRPPLAGLLATIFLLFVFSYGHVMGALFERSFGRHVDELDFPFALIWLGIFAMVAYCLALVRGDLSRVTRVLNALTGLLVVTALLPIAPYEWHRPRTPQLGTPISRSAVTPRQPPDIYYIILDRYGRGDLMGEYLSFDNREFLDFLRGKGFFVAEESCANYAHTILSLSSSLNMTYLDRLMEAMGPKETDITPMYGLVRDFAAVRFLKAHGYRYLQVGSWWEPTRANPQAERVILAPGVRLDEFSTVLWSTTLLRPVLRPLGLGQGARQHRKEVLFQFEALGQLAKASGPKFVFAHLLTPHPPWVFRPDGSLPPAGAQRGAGAYLSQLRYTNLRVEELVEKLLAESERPPIIILQSDEGSGIPLTGGSGRRPPSRLAAAEELHMGVLNAYYLPGVKTDTLPPTISPVNTFRLIFDRYFGADYPLLPDRAFRVKDDRLPYDVEEVTGKVWPAEVTRPGQGGRAAPRRSAAAASAGRRAPVARSR